MNAPEGDGGTLRSQAASGARWMTVATGVRIATQLIQLAVLGRLLDPEAFGLMALVMVVVTLGQVLGDAGVSNAIIHHQDASRRELSSLYWLNLLAGGIVFAIVWGLAPWAVELFDEPKLTGLIRLAAFAFVIAPLGQQFQVLLERELRFRRVALIEATASLAGLGVGVGLALRGAGAESLVWAMLGFAGTKAAALVAWGLASWRPQLRLVWSECRRFLGFGAYQVGTRLVNQLGAQLDKLLVGLLIGAKPLGFYSVSYNLASRPFMTLSPTITRVAFPVFARLQREDARLRAGFLQVIEAISVVMFPLYLLIGVLAAPAIRVFLGPGWEPSIPLLQLLAGVGLLHSLGNPIGSLLLAKGRVGLGFALNVLRLVLDGAAILLVAERGMEAVAGALLFIRAVVMFPLGFWIRWRLLAMQPGEYLRALAPFALAAFGMAAAVGVLDRLVPWPSVLAELVVCTGVGVGCYGGLLWGRERQRLRRLWALMAS